MFPKAIWGPQQSHQGEEPLVNKQRIIELGVTPRIRPQAMLVARLAVLGNFRAAHCWSGT
jgi:hypothetical protein